MSTKPRADAYEKLKDLRRRGVPESEKPLPAGDQLRALYDDIVRVGVPDRFSELIRKLEAADKVRELEMRTIADRVFGDEKKAEAWLQRPNASLSGQKPIDLLKDELGAAVVREMLERIDHGIFA